MKLILDVACGGRMFYFDTQNENVLFCDNRKFNGTLCDGREFKVEPDIVADFTNLPFEDNSFKMVVFDPPHLVRVGDNAWLAKKYGKLPHNWKDMLHDGFSECMRVLAPYGALIFKWNETDISVSRIIEVIGHKPIFGNKSGARGKTHWLCFMKFESEDLK